MPRKPTKHNKSGEIGLSVLKLSDSDIESYLYLSLTKFERSDGLIENSRCATYGQDGRFSVGGQKVAYMYQMVAFWKFGRKRMSEVVASKGADSLTISHLCGTRNCCHPHHIVLERKRINDERTHCHYVLRNVKEASGYRGISKFLGKGWCPHTPTCCERVE